jgi:hypothetical protein
MREPPEKKLHTVTAMDADGSSLPGKCKPVPPTSVLKKDYLYVMRASM